MSYFTETNIHVRYPFATDTQPGLRKSQIGAIHAISAHFTLYDRPAVVVLPTGAGKTAVLMLTPYILRTQRVLVITQSRFVRDQIARDYKTLRTLKQAQALPTDLAVPAIFENKKLISSPEAWEALRAYDVVISTPTSASPARATIPSPPPNLFDLVLIDEAHHSPAPTWNAVIDAFPQAHCVLFTATPFRRDGKEIKGKYIYTYPIQRAFEDEIYGEMLYLPVEPEFGIKPDIALAETAQQVFQQDRQAGFSHAIMVRADTRVRADELAEIYQQHAPSLRLEVVHSGRSQQQTEKVVERLRQGVLDGVICVNMLGEGFDLPNLKIAALHAPHRSLAVTLQFFGRFARVNGDRLGDAKFIAVQSEIGEELAELYQDSAAWGKKIRMVGQERIGEEIFTRDFIEEFQPSDALGSDATLEDISLYSFNLFNHVKLFQIHGYVDLHAFPEIRGLITERLWLNDPQSTIAFLAREEIQPKWASSSALNSIEHHLFIVFFDEPTRLLFICATHREESIYTDIAAIFVKGHPQALSLSKINRVLRSVKNLELFNVGMRNRATGIVAESYRQISGTAAHESIDKADGMLYHRGHIFGRGRGPDGVTTIGVSSLSKIWRLERAKIPGLVRWCQNLARDIANASPFITGIGLDHLDAGHDITTLPTAVALAANWHEDIYQNPPLVSFTNDRGGEQSVSILDFDLLIDRANNCTDTLIFIMKASDFETRLKFTLMPFPLVSYLDDSQPHLAVERGSRHSDMPVFLTNNPLRFHFSDGSLLEGCQLFEAPGEDLPYDNESLMQAFNWTDAKVDIQKEYGSCTPPLQSIHDWLHEKLIASDAIIVFYDHRAGECADYLTISEDSNNELEIRLYHCKKSGGPAAGNRVDDLYEVCGQATKSAQWRNKKKLLQHVRTRYNSGSRFYKGDLTSFINLVEPYPRYELPLEVYAVQPGVSKSDLSSNLATILSTTSRGLVAAGCQRLRMICSG